MNICRFAQEIGEDIVVTKSHHNPKWFASLPAFDQAEGIFRVSRAGYGDTPDEALNDLCRFLKGTTLTDGKRTVMVPADLEMQS